MEKGRKDLTVIVLLFADNNVDSSIKRLLFNSGRKQRGAQGNLLLGNPELQSWV
jgi:hypothetical protein